MRRGLCRGLIGEIGASDFCAAASRLDLDRFDLDLLLRADEAEPLLVRDLERARMPRKLATGMGSALSVPA